MSSETIVIIFILISLVVSSAYFSASETAFSSLKIVRLEEMLKNNKKSNKHHSLKLFKQFDETLSVILVANNIVNISAASVSILLFEKLKIKNPILISTIIMTIIILIFGEFIPKILAKRNPEQFALRLSGLLWLMFNLCKPIVKLVGLFPKNKGQITSTEKELIRTVSKIAKEGQIEKSESILINSALKFDDTRVKSVFTKWKDVVYIKEEATVGDLVNAIAYRKHTRIPVVKRNKVIGYVSTADVIGKSKSTPIKKFMREIHSISQNIFLDDALEMIQRKRSHILVVTKNNQKTIPIGIVTLEDLIEEIIGEVYDETDNAPKVIPVGHGEFIVNGDVNVEQVFIAIQGIIPYEKSISFTNWALSMLSEKNSKQKKFTPFKYDKFIIKWIERKGKSDIFQVKENE